MAHPAAPVAAWRISSAAGEPVATDPCGGPNRDMLSVSGIVPDGVGAAFLTSPDGTAVRADVKDNAYAFVVPRTKRPEAALRGLDRRRRHPARAAPRHPGLPRSAPVAPRPPSTGCRPSPPTARACAASYYRSPAIVVPAPVPSARARRTPLDEPAAAAVPGAMRARPARPHARPRCHPVSGSSRRHDAHPSVTGSLRASGGVAERLNAPVLKTGDGASRSRVRIPPPPLSTRRRQRLAKSSRSSTSCGQSERRLR